MFVEQELLKEYTAQKLLEHFECLLEKKNKVKTYCIRRR